MTLTKVIVLVLGNGLPHWVLVNCCQVSKHLLYCLKQGGVIFLKSGLKVVVCISSGVSENIRELAGYSGKVIVIVL